MVQQRTERFARLALDSHMIKCDAQGLPFVMFTNVRSFSRPPVSSAVSRGTGLEGEPSRHPQVDPPPAMLHVARCALRSALRAALVAFAAAMIRCYIISKGFPLLFPTGDRGHIFVTAKNCYARQIFVTRNYVLRRNVHPCSKTGAICFWPIAWLVGCMFYLIPDCTRF